MTLKQEIERYCNLHSEFDYKKFDSCGGNTPQEKEFIKKFYLWIVKTKKITTYYDILDWMMPRFHFVPSSFQRDNAAYGEVGKIILSKIYYSSNNFKMIMETE